nr:eukaryotic translation initiation factor 3 [Hymenolepis microstoma]
MDAYGVTFVKVSGIALLKIIKHCEGETLLANEHVTGMLFGLVVGNTLEITNCCPLPKIPEDDQNMEAIADYEAFMIKSMRDINHDYLVVGYYQGGYGCSFMSRSLLETLFDYQMLVPESVLLFYDPSCATRGQKGLKSYRLSKLILNSMLETEKKVRLSCNLKNSEMTWECDPSLHTSRTSFTDLLEELPVVVVNSKLSSIVLKDIVDRSNEQTKSPLLQRLDNIYELQFSYQRTLGKLGASGGQSKEQKIKELAPIRLETALACCQTDLYSSSIAQLAGQTVGKLMLAEAIHKYRKEPTNDSE